MKRPCAKALLLLLWVTAACTSSSERAALTTTSPATTVSASGIVVPAPVPCPAGADVVEPGRDLQSALDATGAGRTLCFVPGIYRLERDLFPLPGQTLVFIPGAVLNGSEVVRNWTRRGSYWSSSAHYQNLSDEPWLPDPAVQCPITPTACIYEDVFLDGHPLLQVQALSALDAPNEVFFDKAAGTIYLATDPTKRLVEATVAGSAIRSRAGDVTTDDVTIRGATIEHFAYDGIYTEADNWRIEDSEIRYVHREAIGIYGGSGAVIQNNHIHDNGIIGMVAAGVDALTIQGNELDHNNYLHAGPRAGGYEEGGVKILGARDVDFRGNWSHDNVGDGLWFDTANYDVLIENNVLEDNSRNGLHYEASFDATVRDNTIRSNGTDPGAQGCGILNSTSKNVEYHGNRIEDNAFQAIRILWDNRGQSATFGEYQSANLLFQDNIIVLDDNPQSWVGVDGTPDVRVFTSNNQFQGNTYYAPRDGQRAGARYWRWGGRDLTWVEWRSYGFDSTGSYVPT